RLGDRRARRPLPPGRLPVLEDPSDHALLREPREPREPRKAHRRETGEPREPRKKQRRELRPRVPRLHRPGPPRREPGQPPPRRRLELGPHPRRRRAGGPPMMRELVVLGTASQVPTRYRAHNAYFLRFDDQGFLFDP